MGRKFLEEIGHALPNRKNIVVSSTKNFEDENLLTVPSLCKALEVADTENVYVSGGYALFKEALPIADVLYITEVDTVIEDGDTFFPEFNKDDFDLEILETVKGNINYTRTVYKRKYNG